MRGMESQTPGRASPLGASLSDGGLFVEDEEVEQVFRGVVLDPRFVIQSQELESQENMESRGLENQEVASQEKSVEISQKDDTGEELYSQLSRHGRIEAGLESDGVKDDGLGLVSQVSTGAEKDGIDLASQVSQPEIELASQLSQNVEPGISLASQPDDMELTSFPGAGEVASQALELPSQPLDVELESENGDGLMDIQSQFSDDEGMGGDLGLNTHMFDYEFEDVGVAGLGWQSELDSQIVDNGFVDLMAAGLESQEPMGSDLPLGLESQMVDEDLVFKFEVDEGTNPGLESQDLVGADLPGGFESQEPIGAIVPADRRLEMNLGFESQEPFGASAAGVVDRGLDMGIGFESQEPLGASTGVIVGGFGSIDSQEAGGESQESANRFLNLSSDVLPRDARPVFASRVLVGKPSAASQVEEQDSLVSREKSSASQERVVDPRSSLSSGHSTVEPNYSMDLIDSQDVEGEDDVSEAADMEIEDAPAYSVRDKEDVSFEETRAALIDVVARAAESLESSAETGSERKEAFPEESQSLSQILEPPSFFSQSQEKIDSQSSAKDDRIEEVQHSMDINNSGEYSREIDDSAPVARPDLAIGRSPMAKTWIGSAMSMVGSYFYVRGGEEEVNDSEVDAEESFGLEDAGSDGKEEDPSDELIIDKEQHESMVLVEDEERLSEDENVQDDDVKLIIAKEQHESMVLIEDDKRLSEDEVVKDEPSLEFQQESMILIVEEEHSTEDESMKEDEPSIELILAKEPQAIEEESQQTKDELPLHQPHSTKSKRQIVSSEDEEDVSRVRLTAPEVLPKFHLFKKIVISQPADSQELIICHAPSQYQHDPDQVISVGQSQPKAKIEFKIPKTPDVVAMSTQLKEDETMAMLTQLKEDESMGMSYYSNILDFDTVDDTIKSSPQLFGTSASMRPSGVGIASSPPESGLKRQLLDSPRTTRKKKRVRVVIPRTGRSSHKSPVIMTDSEELLFSVKEIEEEVVKVIEEEADVEIKEEEGEEAKTGMFVNWSIGWNWRQPSGSKVLAAIAIEPSEDIFEIMRKEINEGL